jgi:hypothetical protein
VTYWIHIARSIDRVTLHKDRCSEVPSTSIGSSSDFWEGGWFDYPDKERALAAMEQAGTTEQRCVKPSRVLKKISQRHRPWRVTREIGEKGATWTDLASTSCGSYRSFRLSRGIKRPVLHTSELSKLQHAEVVFPQLPKQ